MLLMYWSFIILAPVIAKEKRIEQSELIILPLKKPQN